MTFSFVRAPEKPKIEVAAAGYGMFRTKNVHHTRARVWVILEESQPILRIGFNHPRTGKVIREDLGPIRSIVVRNTRYDITLADGSGAQLVLAPCVCGAGAVGSAGPSGDAHVVDYIRADHFGWYRQS